MDLKERLGKWLCDHGKHNYEDKIRISGPRNEKGLPVCVFQICKRCYKIGNEVNCHIDIDNDKTEG